MAIIAAGVRLWVVQLLPLGASAAWMIYVLYGSMAERPAGADAASTSLIPHADLAVHFVFYGIMAPLLRWSATIVRGTGTTAARARATAPFAFAVAYGGPMELLETTIDARSGAWDDLLADGAGALTVVLAIEDLLRLRGRVAKRGSGCQTTYDRYNGPTPLGKPSTGPLLVPRHAHQTHHPLSRRQRRTSRQRRLVRQSA